MDNITKIKFEEWQDETYDDGKLWAGHYGQVLQIEGLTLPDGHIEVHFSLTEHTGDAHPYIGTVKDNVITVDIPDFIFQKENLYDAESYEAYAFIYQTDENSGQTIKKITFTIQARPNVTANVPEDQKDPFLEEVRQIMAETKEIAQSVREDADKGVFDGEQGPKGDAGGLGCIPCKELPTTDIVSNVYYLLENGTEEIEVKGETVVKNKYTEYMYINGEWEIVGSISIGMNLSDYVKKDDFATTENAGVVKMAKYSSYGLYMANDGTVIAIMRANDSEIDAKENGFKPITPKNLDYAVMKALSDSKLEWTEEQKQLARALLGAIGSEYYAEAGNSGHAGFVKPNGEYGTGVNTGAEGLLYLICATDADIDKKTQKYKPITPFYLDYAVKKALSDCKLSGDDVWTDEEKAKALELLGVILEHNLSTPWTVVKRGAYGVIVTGTPTQAAHATTKKYVDDRVGSVESILTELHTYAQIKIGGEA